jgi:type IV pilus assembly protein PilV
MKMRRMAVAGFSLIEILVTVMILMFGILGLAGLQGAAINAESDAHQRAQALLLLQDMADRINANRKHAAACDRDDYFSPQGTHILYH